MLSVFPNLLNWWMIAPVILRVALGLAFLHEAYGERKNNQLIALTKFFAGIGLLIGYLTQIGALIAVVVSLYELWQKGSTDQRLFKLAIAISLLFLGPGIFSLDLPL